MNIDDCLCHLAVEFGTGHSNSSWCYEIDRLGLGISPDSGGHLGLTLKSSLMSTSLHIYFTYLFLINYCLCFVVDIILDYFRVDGYRKNIVSLTVE